MTFTSTIGAFYFFTNFGAHLLNIYCSAIVSYFGSWNSECKMVWR
jgi:hypothetical protein